MYVRPDGETEARPLIKNQRRLLNVGDEFRLLPDAFCYQLCGSIEASTSCRNVQGLPSTCRKLPDASSSGVNSTEKPIAGGSRQSGPRTGCLFPDDSSDLPPASEKQADPSGVETSKATPASEATGSRDAPAPISTSATAERAPSHKEPASANTSTEAAVAAESTAEPQTNTGRSEWPPVPGRQAQAAASSSTADTAGRTALPASLSNGTVQVCEHYLIALSLCRAPACEKE